ncbi:MAG: respiratory nitrate reductase subunit gamma [Bacteroidetes bacterium]|nr:respiratory nitrate reductase subunit gamma [Bacteroidota bacterium]
MSFVSGLYGILFYLAAINLIVGVTLKIIQYSKAPAPLKIATTPAPLSKPGVAFRLFKEVVFFESLFKSSRWTWIFGWVFHFALFLVILRHIRYFTDPVWTWVALIQPFGLYAGFAMLFGLLGLLARRIFVDRVKYISAPSDYLMLILIMAIGGSGLLMKYIFHTDVVAIKAFMLGLISFNFSTLPADLMLLTHLALVIFLMLIFPHSKLLHVPGLFFSPTRNQVDNPREKRHIAPWAEKLEASDGQ